MGIQTTETLLALQNGSGSGILKSADYDCAHLKSALININFGRRTTSASAGTGLVLVQGSVVMHGQGVWFDLARFSLGIAAAASEAVSGTEAVGATVIEVASTTSLAVGDVIYFHNPTVANGEFGEIAELVADTSITLRDGLRRAQTGATIYNKAQRLAARVNLRNFARLRVIVNNPTVEADIFDENYAAEAHLVGET